MPKKCILVLLDGLGDRSYNEFNAHTPLQAAKTPHLDKIAKDGATGLYHPAICGMALPSENAHFSIFGYDLDDFPGRGFLEALGADIRLTQKEVAVLAHFTSIHNTPDGAYLKEGKPSLTAEEQKSFIKIVRTFESYGILIRFHPVGGIRGIITLKGNVSPFFTDSDPFINGRPLCDITPYREYEHHTATIHSASALKKYLSHAYEVLNAHPLNIKRKKNGQMPVNGILTQRAGQAKKVIPFTEKYGLKGLLMASGLIYWGLGRYIGMDIKKVDDTDDPGEDLADRIKKAYSSLDQYDFVHVHTKAPDEAAHTKNPMQKKSVIESLDRGIGKVISPILNDPDVFLIVTADHSTPSGGPLIHSGESVPVVFHGEGVRRDAVSQFDEVSVSGGAVGHIRGKELIYLILNHLDKSKLHGIMDTPDNQPYWPGNYDILKMTLP